MTETAHRRARSKGLCCCMLQSGRAPRKLFLPEGSRFKICVARCLYGKNSDNPNKEST